MKNNKTSIDTIDTMSPMVSSAVSPLETKTKLPKIIEENVGNFCPVCGKTIFSNILEIDGKVYLEKNCCTRELVFMENDVDFFKKFKKYNEVEPPASNPKNYQEWLCQNPNCGTFTYFLFVTSRCNANCPICYEKFNNYLNSGLEASIEEIRRVIKKYKYKSREIVIMGGEPTVREDLPEMIRIIKDSGNYPAIITNGLKLEDKNYVKKLKKAGLNSILLQFDGFDKAANIELRGQDFLEKRLKVLKNIEEVGGLRRLTLLPIIKGGLNEAEMSKIIQFGLKSKIINRIHFAGLRPRDRNETTTGSDLIKIMERDGYLDREYLLEVTKMYRNVYKVTRKIFEGTPLEGCILKRLRSAFYVVHFKKGINPLQLLFQKEEIEKINKILVKTMSKKGRIASLCILLKNSKELIKSPLTVLLKEKLFILNQRKPSPNKLLEVSFSGGVCDIKGRFLKSSRNTGMILYLSTLPLDAFAIIM